MHLPSFIVYSYSVGCLEIRLQTKTIYTIISALGRNNRCQSIVIIFSFFVVVGFFFIFNFFSRASTSQHQLHRCHYFFNLKYLSLLQFSAPCYAIMLPRSLCAETPNLRAIRHPLQKVDSTRVFISKRWQEDGLERRV